MAVFENFPYTNFHELNLDWIIREMKRLVAAWDEMSGQVTATAHTSAVPEVTVTGDLKEGMEFDFGLVPGATGAQGPEGPEGPAGEGIEIKDVLSSVSDLPATGDVGDVYEVLDGGVYHLYVWSETSQAFIDTGTLGSVSPSGSTPLMDGTASAGSATTYSRGDHVHPHDTSKWDVPVSGTDIKTINTASILGSGDISLQTPLTPGSDYQTPLSGTDFATVNGYNVWGAKTITCQEVLVNQTNIKSVNTNSLLGSGDLHLPTIYSGTGDPVAATGVNGDIYVKYSGE